MGKELAKTIDGFRFGVGSKYVEAMFRELGLTRLKGATCLKWDKGQADELEVPVPAQRFYRQAVGKLMWLDRVDLKAVVGKAAAKLGHATETDVQNIKRILRYIRGNPGTMEVRPVQLELDLADRACPGSVLTYADADWAGDDDRRSISGVATWVRGACGWYPVSCTSRKQSSVALSSGEAELVAALSGACEGLGVQSIWQWLLAFGKPTEHSSDHEKAWPMQILCCDSSAAISIMRRAGATRRTGHIELKAFFLQQWCARPQVKVAKVKTDEMLADGLTKVVAKIPENQLRCLGLALNGEGVQS